MPTLELVSAALDDFHDAPILAIGVSLPGPVNPELGASTSPPGCPDGRGSTSART
ncbi:hypothetical protein G7085_15320 [Tessaracoccus sp. HDW20]|uniref:hypothetical protein n=1 Tax=Tessaracoccus coleopterorum TaxID=2714950 RepID=UPI0018D3184B|nr:hypothetical protein [Tessaracoccus coleopterorum]NHB85516.1 hypothetical protein [Tessaracoccus coleopterorum]